MLTPSSSGKIKGKYIIIVTGILLSAYLCFIFQDILKMLAISFLLSLIFDPIVCKIEKQGFSRIISLLIVFLLFGLVLFLGFNFIIPEITSQFDVLSNSLSKSTIQQSLQNLSRSIAKFFPFVKSGTVLAKIQSFFTSYFYNLLDSISNLVSGIVSILAVSIIIPFMTYFMLKDRKGLLKGILNVIPNKYFEMSYDVTDKISYQLGRFVRGWIIDASLVGLLSGIGLSVLGIHNAVPIGLIAGIGHLIPYFGPIIGGIPAIIISVMQFGDFSMLPRILVMFLIIYAIDNGFIQPNVYSRSVGMHPLLIIVLIVAGSQLMGIAGMLLAVPLATVIKTASKEIYTGYKSFRIANKNS
jgi:predicted PurR-regulated permease PerM